METITSIETTETLKGLAGCDLEVALAKVELAVTYEDVTKYNKRFKDKVEHYKNKYGEDFVRSYCDAYKKLKNGESG